MKIILNAVLLIILAAMPTLAADIKISDLPLSTSPSPNTFIPASDMSAATPSVKLQISTLRTSTNLTDSGTNVLAQGGIQAQGPFSQTAKSGAPTDPGYLWLTDASPNPNGSFDEVSRFGYNINEGGGLRNPAYHAWAWEMESGWQNAVTNFNLEAHLAYVDTNSSVYRISSYAVPMNNTNGWEHSSRIFNETWVYPASGENWLVLNPNGSRWSPLTFGGTNSLIWTADAGGHYYYLKPEPAGSVQLYIYDFSSVILPGVNCALGTTEVTSYLAMANKSIALRNASSTTLQDLDSAVNSLASQVVFKWNAAANLSGAYDIGIGRDSAGILKITDGSTGLGSIKASAVTAASGAFTNSLTLGGNPVLTNVPSILNVTTINSDEITTPAITKTNWLVGTGYNTNLVDGTKQALTNTLGKDLDAELALLAPKASPTFTGTATIPTAAITTAGIDTANFTNTPTVMGIPILTNATSTTVLQQRVTDNDWLIGNLYSASDVIYMWSGISTFRPLGDADPSITGTASSIAAGAALPGFVNWVTASASAGQINGMSGGGRVIYPAKQWYMFAYIQLVETNAIRISVGATSGSLSTIVNDDTASGEGAWFHYADAVSPNWYAVSRNNTGGSIESNDTGVQVAASTAYKLAMWQDKANSRIIYYINGTSVRTNVTYLPGTAANLLVAAGAETTENVVKNFRLSRMTWKTYDQ